MHHLIRFTSPEGRDGMHVADTLEEAVGFVERLRNSEEASDVHLYRLTEVPIEFKTYYRVEVGGVDAGAGGAPPVPATPVEHAPPVTPTESVGEPAAANGRRLFSRT